MVYAKHIVAMSISSEEEDARDKKHMTGCLGRHRCTLRVPRSKVVLPPTRLLPLWHMAECVQARCQTGVKILATKLQNVRTNSAPPSSVLQSHSKRYMQYLSCGVCGRLSVEDRQGATGLAGGPHRTVKVQDACKGEA